MATLSKAQSLIFWSLVNQTLLEIRGLLLQGEPLA